MSGGRRAAAIAAAVAAALAGTAVGAPLPAPLAIEWSPDDGGARVAKHLAAADAAAAAGDADLRARHLLLACAWNAMRGFDVALTVAPCPEVKAQAPGAALDVQLGLVLLRAEMASWMLDVDGTIAGAREVIARGAALPAGWGSYVVRRARWVLGNELIEAGRFDEGLAELAQARADSVAADDPLTPIAVAAVECRAFDVLGDLPRARAACDVARAACTARYDYFLDLNLSFLEAQLAWDAGDLEAARAGYQRTLALARRPGGEVRWVHAGALIASAELALGRPAAARQTLEALGREAPPVMQLVFRSLLQHQWGKLLRAEGDLDGAARAFEVSRQTQAVDVATAGWRGLARARALRGDLAGAQAALEEAIAKVEASRRTITGAATRASYVEAYAGLYGDLVGVLWDRAGAAAAARALAVAEAGEARALRDTLAAAHAAGHAAPPLDVAALQAALAPEQAVIELVIADHRMFALTATRQAVTMQPLAVLPDELAVRVGFFRQLVEDGAALAELAPAGQRLYRELLAPAVAALPSGIRTLLIVPGGPARELPFDALIVDGAPLIDRFELVVLPAAAVLVGGGARPAPTAAALVVAPRDTPLGALPAAPVEAAVVARRIGGATVLAGDRATEAAVTAAAPGRFAVLHLASHAEVDPAMPLRSALVLAPGDAAHDGRWRAEEIYAAPLTAELVVLAACRTAAGRVTPGEGPLSLARAFLAAGAAATVATLWDVDDAAGPAFADALYAALAHGQPIGAAVRQAKRALAAQGAPPRVWAAYVLTGTPTAHVHVAAAPSRSRRWPVALGALAVVVVGGAALARRRRTAAVGAAVVVVGALVLVLRTGGGPPTTRWRPGATPAVRGAARAPLAVEVVGATVRWTPVADGARARLEAFAADGAPLPLAAATVPDGARWLRVTATRGGVVVARSPLTAVDAAAPR